MTTHMHKSAHAYGPPADEVWRYGACGAHAAYPSRAAAKQHVRRHPTVARDCGKCYAGMKISAFPCRNDSTHWHIGHRWRGR